MNDRSGVAAHSGIPAEMRALVLEGVGWDHVALRRVPVPRPGPRQMLARVDAAGICTSLLKLIDQGPQHSLVYGWDASAFPLVLGDEGSVTVVAVGSELEGRFAPGQRYVVQPAVDHAPIGHRERYRNGGRGIDKVAVGYTLPGHLAEYILITEETIAAGCLLPVPNPTLPFAHAALSEPLSCVVSAQDHHLHLVHEGPLAPRQVVKGLKSGGVAVIIGAGAMGRMHVDLALSYRPRAIVVGDLIEARLALVRRLFSARAERMGLQLRAVNVGQEDLGAVVAGLTDALGADDVIVAVGSPQAVAGAQGLLGRGAVLNLFGGLQKGQEMAPFDTSAIHYKEVNVTGSSGGYPWDIARTLELMTEGALDPSVHITQIGDLDHAIEFLRMVKAQAIDGKAVVYPHRRAAAIRAVAQWTANDERAYLG